MVSLVEEYEMVVEGWKADPTVKAVEVDSTKIPVVTLLTVVVIMATTIAVADLQLNVVAVAVALVSRQHQDKSLLYIW